MYYLFNRFTLEEFYEEAVEDLVTAFGKLTNRDLESADTDQLKDRLLQPITAQVPVIADQSKIIEYPQYELPVEPRDVLQKKNRSIKKVRRKKVSYNFEGDYRFFFIEPKRHTCSMPFGLVEEAQISFIYDFEENDPDSLYEELDTNNLLCIYSQLEQLRKDILPVNQRLRKLTEKWLAEKFEKQSVGKYSAPVIRLKSNPT